MHPFTHHIWKVEISTTEDEFSELVAMTEANAELVAVYLKNLESEGKITHWAVTFLNDSTHLMPIDRLSHILEKHWGAILDYYVPGYNKLKQSEWEKKKSW